MPEIALRAEGLHKHFGGLRAVSNVAIDVHVGEVHAVIGPNGAGKSTLINLLSGELYANSGAIIVDTTDITRLAPDRRARAGLGRAYQKTTIFLQFSVQENVRLARKRARARRCGCSAACSPTGWRLPLAAHVGCWQRQMREPQRQPASTKKIVLRDYYCAAKRRLASSRR